MASLKNQSLGGYFLEISAQRVKYRVAGKLFLNRAEDDLRWKNRNYRINMSQDARSIIKHEWLQVLVMVVTVAGIFFWCRSESKEDYRHMEANLNTNLQAIYQEMKDFHGRLERQDAEFKSGILLLEEKIKFRA